VLYRHIALPIADRAAAASYRRCFPLGRAALVRAGDDPAIAGGAHVHGDARR
jgi:hypothetical protein